MIKKLIATVFLLSLALFAFVGVDRVFQTFGSKTQTDDALSSEQSISSPNLKQEDENLLIADVAVRDHVRGPRDAGVSIVEFVDLDCPYCAQFHPTMLRIMQNYPDVNWIYRHFPLDPVHPNAFTKAVAAECVSNNHGNDAFWKLIDFLLQNQTLTPEQLPAAVEALGYDKIKFETCFATQATASRVRGDQQQALAAGGGGTPFTIILFEEETIPLRGLVSYETVAAILDSLAEQK